MEMPTAYCQVVTSDGWIVDLSEQDGEVIAKSIEDSIFKTISVIDIYGAKVTLILAKVSCLRQWTKESGDNYKEMHDGDKWDEANS